MSLVKDFLTYCSCYEIPRAYAIWSAVALVGATTMRRVYIKQGDIVHHGNIYVCLVGEQGVKKSTPMSFARAAYEEAFPDMPVAAAMQSREDICKFMASDDDKFFFTNEHNVQVEYHPFAMFINELKNFLSYNPAGMIEFLTDIYDRHFFDASTIKRGLEKFPNPCINILACETPQWIIDKLKSSVLVGGLARRIIFVVESDALDNDGRPISIPRPIVTPEAKEALKRVKRHLHVIEKIAGEFQWSPEADEKFQRWYHENKRIALATDEPLLRGYRRTKDTQLLKLCMLLALAEHEPRLLITPELLDTGLAMLDGIERNLAKLTIASGRNELVAGQQQLLDLIERNGGYMPEKALKVRLDKELNPMEQVTVIRHLEELELIKRLRLKFEDGVIRECLALPSWVEAAKQRQNKGGDATCTQK